MGDDRNAIVGDQRGAESVGAGIKPFQVAGIDVTDEAQTGERRVPVGDADLDQVRVLDVLTGRATDLPRILEGQTGVRNDALAVADAVLQFLIVPVIETLLGRIEQLDAGVGGDIGGGLGVGRGQFPRVGTAAIDRDQRLGVSGADHPEIGMAGTAGAHGHEGSVVEMVLGEEEMAVVDERHAEQGDERTHHREFDERGTALARAAWRLRV